MTITYTVNGNEHKLIMGPDGKWSGTQASMVNAANECPGVIVRELLYYPMPWHEAKAIADALGGTLDEPEPEFETGEPAGGGVF